MLDKNMITFTVDGQPKIKQRVRFSKKNKKPYTPYETISYENWVKTCYKNQIGDIAFPSTEPLKISITAYFQIPTTWSKKKKAQAADGIIKPTNSKDVDNIAKIILDSLNGIAYIDDHYVTDLKVKKRYSIIPRVEITIDEVKE